MRWFWSELYWNKHDWSKNDGTKMVKNVHFCKFWKKYSWENWVFVENVPINKRNPRFHVNHRTEDGFSAKNVENPFTIQFIRRDVKMVKVNLVLSIGDRRFLNDWMLPVEKLLILNLPFQSFSFKKTFFRYRMTDKIISSSKTYFNDLFVF